MNTQTPSTRLKKQVHNARVGLSHGTVGGIAGLGHDACTVNIPERIK